MAIAVSALWEKELYTIEEEVTVSQSFQLRELPFVTERLSYFGSSFKADILRPLFKDLRASWMYSAALQFSVNAAQPAWSRDGWTFVPVHLPISPSANTSERSTSEQKRLIDYTSFSVEVPAISAQLHCSTLLNTVSEDSWLLEVNTTQIKLWNNRTSNSRPWREGWKLMNHITTNDNITMSLGNPPITRSFPLKTNVLASGITPVCCGVGVDEPPQQAVLAHWSAMEYCDESNTYQGDTPNVTIKWIVGDAPVSVFDEGQPQLPAELIWPKPPRLYMLNCAPHFETATAKVDLDPFTLQVQNYTLLTPVSPFPYAMSDDFVLRDNNSTGVKPQNITTSFGFMFKEALIRASQLNYLGGCDNEGNACAESLDDRTFNFREPGINMDFMSKSMLTIANGSIETLLNYDLMAAAANQTFAIFFKHFASSSVDMGGDGGWVFQRPTEKIRKDLSPPVRSDVIQLTQYEVKQAAKPSIAAILTREREALRMSAIAVWLSLVVLMWLVVTTALIANMKHRYFSPLRRKFETVSDILLMLVDSEKYLDFTRQAETDLDGAKVAARMKLGWFASKSGEMKWGVEMVGDEEDISLDSMRK